MTGTTARLAFFDVDETLIDTKSMFDFLRFRLAERGDDGSLYAQQAGQLHRAAAGGVPRDQINRGYYRLFAGAHWADLLADGARWYEQLLRRPQPFIAEGIGALQAHQAAGHTPVLISGSFRACLDPVAEHLGVTTVLCTEPLLDAEGHLTGEVRRPMIGDNKRDAVLELMDELGARAADCFGYGDHASDLAFLTEVGHPTIVGGDEELRATAQTNGWPVLGATTCAAPAATA